MGLLRSAARATISSSSGIATPEKWVVDWFKGGEASAAGVHVSADTALEYGPFFAALRVLAEDVGSLPLHLYERLEQGKRRAPEHPLYPVLHDAANPMMTAMQLRETLQAHAVSWGDGIAELVWRNGQVVEAWPLRPDRLTIEVVPSGRAGRVRIRYRYDDDANGIHATLLPDQVLHVAGLGFDGIRGYSIVSVARNAIGLGIATERYGSHFFRNGSRPSGVLSHPKVVSPEARKRMKADWESLHRGLDNAQRIAILEEGVSFDAIGVPPEDAQFLETRKFQVSELVRFTRVPAHKLGDLERATFSNIEHQSLDYVQSALRPWLVRWEQAIRLRALNSEERRQYFAEHLIDGFLRGDAKTRADALAVRRNWGTLNADEWREIENENPLPDGQGQTYLVPLNMVPLDGLSAGGDDDGRGRATVGLRSAEGRRRIAKSFVPLIVDLDERMAKLERAEVGSLVRRHLEEDRGRARSTSAFLAAAEELYRGLITDRAVERWLPLATTMVTEVSANAAADIGADSSPELERWTRRYVESHVAYRSASAVGQLRKVLDGDPDDPAGAVRGRLDEWVEKRPKRTATWESIQLSEGTAREVWRESGVRRMRWEASPGLCEACQSLDGVVVAIEQPFVKSGGSQGQIEEAGRDTLHPPLHPGCDCSIVPD